MTKADFSTLIEQPERTREFENDLRRLTDDYPYFHTAHSLLLQAVRGRDEAAMQEQLERSAICVRDRSLLYLYLYEPVEFRQKTGQSPAPEETVKPEPQPEIKQPETIKVTPKKVEQNASPRKQATVEEILDAFLATPPQKIVPRKTDYQVQLSDEIPENKELATETLAEVYVTQGYFDKAVKIYEQLILKNPEKSVYFAAKIKSLKN